jgi:hypothetical protein
MGGTVRGQIDCYTNESTEYRNTAVTWKTWYDFFQAHPLMTRIAYNVGSGGTGTDMWDGANPWGNHCWAVWEWGVSAARAYPIYVLMQCESGGGATNQAMGVAPGDPSTHGGSSTGTSYSHLTIAFAIGVGGDENPWNGTTNNDGTDTKGGSAAMPLGNDGIAGVWRFPASGGTNVLVYPRSNNIGGTYAVNRADLMPAINDANASATRFNIIMDDDNLFMHSGGSSTRYIHAGLMAPHDGLTIDYPWMAFYTTAPVIETTISGRLGGCPLPDSSDPEPVQAVNLDSHTGQGSQPNNLFSPAQYDLLPLFVRLIESPLAGLLGTFGTSADNFNLFVDNCPHASTSPTKDRIVHGNTTQNTLKICVPWDGATVYGSNFTRAGITF